MGSVHTSNTETARTQGYEYDENRRWLSGIQTKSATDTVLQNMTYSFDKVGNVLGYTNTARNYTTRQSYAYDGLYQLVSAKGTSTYSPVWPADSSDMTAYKSTYEQSWRFDNIGNMKSKYSETSDKPVSRHASSDLDYSFKYTYMDGYAHRTESADNMYYTYDANGNITNEHRDRAATLSELEYDIALSDGVYSLDYGIALPNQPSVDTSSYSRTYVWNERNLLKTSVENGFTVSYRYGADGERAIKSSTSGETLYFNNLWQMSSTSLGMRQTKHVYVGSSRIATKNNWWKDTGTAYEKYNTYWYHADHLGSAQLVSDWNGQEYERIEYTPYGELWIEKVKSGYEALPYRFTGKEMDSETGLYYYGARYLDPKYSRWLSTDPALSDYMAGSKAGGGAYNPINFNLYHYAGNNPIKYTDPDGRKQNLAQKVFAKALNFAATHNEKAANFIKDHTNVSITRNVYEGETFKGDETTYYQDNLSVEVCGIPLNDVQCQSTPDRPDLPGRDTIPNGTTGKADVGVSGATKDYIKDTLLFDDKGDFLHIKKPGTTKPGSWGCTIPKNDADVKETMDILRKDLGIENGKGKVKYSFDNSSEYRQNHRKENQQ